MATAAATTIESQQQIYTVGTADTDNTGGCAVAHLTRQYTIRGLHQDELKEWAAFCASVFAYKKPHPPPADYFYRHFVNDPDHGPTSLIRVAVMDSPTKRIVASCRIFLRILSLGGSNNASSIQAGGIGEVCTDSTHRRQGLSKALLQNAIEIMKERKLAISLLHAAPGFFPVYQSIGYSCSQSRWTTMSLLLTELKQYIGRRVDNETFIKYNLRPVVFPQDTALLHGLHQKYSRQRLIGCVVRSKEYWNQYLSVELEASLWVLTDGEETTCQGILAWCGVRQRNQCYQLCEFGVDTERCDVADALENLLPKVMADMNVKGHKIALNLPHFVFQELQLSRQNPEETVPWIDWSSVQTNVDEGWMYLALDKDKKFDLSNVDGTDPERKPHFIWPSDSF